MKKLFNLENPIMQTVSRLTDLLILSILWSLCSIPLITIGPATAALYYVTLKMVEESDSSICKSFFRSFVQNLPRGIILTLVAAAMILVLYWDRSILYARLPSYSGVISLVFLVFAYFLVMALSFLFPLLSRYENTVLGTVKNAFLLAIGYLPRAVLMAALNLIPLAVYLFAPNTFFTILPVWIIFAPGVIAYFCSMLLKKPFGLAQASTTEE